MTTPPDPALLARKRAAARAALWFEQLWPAVWPAIGLLGAYLCAALLDLPAWLPPWPRVLLLTAVLLGAAGLLWHGLRRVRAPSAALADRRLEQATGLRHRPLAALADRPAAATPEALAVWQVHLSRLAAQIPRLRVGRPRPGLANRDVWALRGALVVMGVASVVIAGPEALPRLRRAAVPSVPPGPAAPGTIVQAWVTPPAYTGLPPVFLHAGTPAVSVPTGSHLTVSVTGGRGEPTLSVNDAPLAARALDAESWQAERDLSAELGGAGHLSVGRGGGALASWTLTLIPDLPPTIGFADPPGAATSGGRAGLPTRLSWRAQDDYGVASVAGELRLRDRPGAAPLVVSAPLAGSPKSARGASTQDLTAHPWAGLPVVGRLVAKDAPGQMGVSADAGFTLPERPFHNPVARALIAVRRQLSLTPEDRRPAAMTVDALADMPDSFDGSSGVLLNLRSIATLLVRGREPTTVEEAQARMWALALALEEGGTDRTAHALEQARQALRNAMDRANQTNPPTPEAKAELDRRMQELREAIQKHMEALAEQARREGNETPPDPATPQLTARDLDRMAQRMQDAAREGRMDDAKQQMAELERLLEQLQNARPEHGEQREKQNAERRQRGRQQQDAVQDLVQREGGLMDRSQTRSGPNPQPNPGAQQTPSVQQRDADARAQRAMRRALGELMQRFGDLTGQVPAPLGEADGAMREAGQALADGRDAAAGAAQQRAIEALQKGGREMGQQLSRQFGSGQQPGEGEEGQEGQEGQDGGDGQMGDGGNNPTGNADGQTTGPRPGDQSGPPRRRAARRDPLGRPLQEGTSGTEDSGATRVPDTMEEARTRAIQDELRRRGADRTRPQPELDYIDRLLKPF